MPNRTSIARLTDIIEAIERIRTVVGDVTLDRFEADWQKQWLVVRGLEIISEASRHFDAELKARHSEIPWSKVAGIGNVLRHGTGDRIQPKVTLRPRIEMWRAALHIWIALGVLRT